MRFGKIIRIAEPRDAYSAFSALKDGGFSACHLVYKPEVYSDSDAEIIRSAAEEYGIEISAVFAGFRDSYTKWNIFSDYKDAGINSEAYGSERVEYLKSVAVFVRKLGITDMLIHAGFVSNNPFSEEYLRMVDILTPLARYAAELGVNILLETGGESPITLVRLIEDTGCKNLFVNLDTANLIMYGYGNPCDAVYTFGSLIRSVHIKDGVPPTDTKTLGQETNFGEGFVDFPRVIKGLKALGFDGPYIIEREINDGKSDAKIAETKSQLIEMMG